MQVPDGIIFFVPRSCHVDQFILHIFITEVKIHRSYLFNTRLVVQVTLGCEVVFWRLRVEEMMTVVKVLELYLRP